MKRHNTGKYEVTVVGGEKVRAFVPSPLPPKPPLNWFGKLFERQQSAALALGRLDSISSLLPDPALFLYSYVRKEAVLSSQIEGTQSSLSDLLVYESQGTPGVPLDDVCEVSNYVAAMDHGLKRLRGNFPLSLRLIREIHEKLLSQGRGDNKQPGEFRRSQNWIGGSRPGTAAFVPPPPHLLQDCLGHFEKFLHEVPENFPPLVKAGLAHVQFETIHPFLDGNGRVGRLLISLILCESGILKEPMLYLSLFFKQHRSTYYDLLQQVRTDGNWESWLEFFFEGIEVTATKAVATTRKLMTLFDRDKTKIQDLGRMALSVLRVFEFIQKYPLISPQRLTKMARLTPATINKALEHLAKLKIVHETTGKERNRLFAYTEYLKLLNQEMD